jgi:hypothetical protein
VTPSIQDPKENRDAGSEGNPTAKDASGSSPVVRPVIEIPEAVLQEYRANQKAQARETKKYHRLTRWAVIGAWFYAFIAGFQLYSSERALIGVTSSQMRVYAEGKPVEVSSAFNNVGRTPATHCIMRNGVYFADKGALVNWDNVAPAPSWSDIHRTSMPIIPGSLYHFPTATIGPLTADLEKQLTDGTKVIVVLTAADYLDQFFIVHRLRSCEMYYLKTSEFLFCKNNNKAE